ncbi:Ankyrin repeat and LEM domain-containing protein 2 [Oopsacas minuta]|uniref:Signal peptidase complex subunit 2 n=1 Tax=Oopsacas minuta TaxID=111878 RepID=A0AAV7JCR9_9METZ|nr:Ankyrin repeat and LEM domain-containing protein 2 [Oopsacas minuta]
MSRSRNSDFFQNLIDKPIKLDKWDTTGVKHGLDDVIKKIFNKGLNFQERNQLTDAKIIMSAMAVLLAVVAFTYDYFTGYPKSFTVLIICVVGYALLMLALSIFSLLFEKSYVYSGTERDQAGFITNSTVKIATVLKRFDHNYTVTITYQNAMTKFVKCESKSCSIAELFDSKGNLGIDIFDKKVTATTTDTDSLPNFAEISNEELKQRLVNRGVNIEIPINDFTRSIMINKLIKTYELDSLTISKDTEQPKVDKQFPTKSILYGINLSAVEDIEPPLSEQYFCESKSELTSIHSRYKDVRFKVCKNKEEALEFSLQRFSSSSSKPAPDADPSDYKTPKQQDLNQIKLAIERTDSDRLEQLIASNPKLLVTSSDVPTILQIRCHYNALHIAALSDNAIAAKIILKHLNNEQLWELLYPKDQLSIRSSRRTNCLSSYVNTGDALLGETPLHFACKFGSVRVTAALITQSFIEIAKPNKEGQIPFEVICSRKYPERKRQIQNLFSENYFVPVYRSPDNATPPILGKPVHRHSDKMVSMDTEERDGTPIKEQLLCRAWAGPLNQEKANKFYKDWKSPPGMKSPLYKSSRDRRLDPEKGLEYDGRQLAKNFNVGWREYWDFLGEYCDLTDDNGKQLLEEYIQKRFITTKSKESTLEDELQNLSISSQQKFLCGDLPCKSDYRAIDALGEEIDIDRDKYPGIYQWKELMLEYKNKVVSTKTVRTDEQYTDIPVQPYKRTLLHEFNTI